MCTGKRAIHLPRPGLRRSRQALVAHEQDGGRLHEVAVVVIIKARDGVHIRGDGDARLFGGSQEWAREVDVAQRRQVAARQRRLKALHRKDLLLHVLKVSKNGPLPRGVVGDHRLCRQVKLPHHITAGQAVGLQRSAHLLRGNILPDQRKQAHLVPQPGEGARQVIPHPRDAAVDAKKWKARRLIRDGEPLHLERGFDANHARNQDAAHTVSFERITSSKRCTQADCRQKASPGSFLP